ncbi:riboflavin synthase subunit alpha [Psychrobium sp. 1_MG-2023]|uniref:riboflavin synthase subunit alpha n=1 Tax=Psychrobium sp. 1_MG-2023 TaxID=3062624 RepID=UPI000C32AED8|nr:riboflavin synthase subunit alpha [Psychrobium sp. 1_MG-2023]MDP2561667.1 riboflavin synthase subunit alpha [Psychrobium sp. 1_MG-2023]PKF57072.1 riboflavin synthase [Alteromonadales bacterium alter-6D02]
MFTGIIQAKVKIKHIVKQTGLWQFAMEFGDELRENLNHGASVAHNGVCLTVAKQDQQAVYFDVMQETLAVTNLADCCAGDVVNIERALKFGDELGGHVLSGHVHATATLVSRVANESNSTLRFECDAGWMKYILPKGFISIDGASLTLGKVGTNWFEVYLIPETRVLTTLDEKAVGSRYNIEIDSQTQAIVDTVERVLAAKNIS